MSKVTAQRIHVARRSAERLGFSIPRARQRQLAQKVRQGCGTFVERKTNRISIWIVDGIKIAYDKNRGTVATVLERDALS